MGRIHPGQTVSETLQAGKSIMVRSVSAATAYVNRQRGATRVENILTAGQSQTFGPFNLDVQYSISASGGAVDYTEQDALQDLGAVQTSIAATAYTLLPTDRDRRLSFTSNSAVTVTVPPGLDAGFEVDIEQLGTGQITVSPGAGVTINNFSGQTKTGGQYAIASLLGRDTVDTYNWAGITG